jgi:hypothetical protein
VSPPPEASLAESGLLDGFLLLEVCKVEFPEEAVSADVHGLGLTQVLAIMPVLSVMGLGGVCPRDLRVHR